MNSAEIDEYRNYLLNAIPTAKPKSGGRMVLCRCMECSDSDNPTHAHFYISIPRSENELSFFYCHKCHCKGVIDHNKLLKWGYYDDRIATLLIQHNRHCFNLPSNKGFAQRSVYTLYNNFITDCKASEVKLSYINTRLGTSLTYMDLLEKKIVLNINDVLRYNHVQNFTRDPALIEQFNEYFLGFISADNAFINMRRLVKEGVVSEYIDERYMRYNIFNKYDNTEKFYIMPCELNINSPERIKVNIAEGEFDILSIFYNLRKDPNQIYMSISGSGYEGVVRYVLSTLKLFYIELHLYPDNDKHGNLRVLKIVKDLADPFNIPVYIHRNNMPNQKDFGVDITKIRETVQKM